MLFTNEFDHTVDDKGRLSLPIRHREQIGDTVALGRGSDGQVQVLPIPVYRTMIELAEQAVAQGESEEDASLDLLLSYVEVEIDRQGRIILPAGLRRHAKLGTDVTIAGQGDHIEIWNRDLWQKRWDDWVAEKQAAATARRALEAGQATEKARKPLFGKL
jgi:MraZ protein